MKSKFLGDGAFYRRVSLIAIPILIQNIITNFVNMLDNVMVGRIGTLPMSGVSIVNQLLFIFNLCIFGAVSGAGIFTAQYVGKQDHEGIRHTFRFKLLAAAAFTALAVLIFLTAGPFFISLFLRGEGAPEEIAATMDYAMQYLRVMLIGLLPFAISNAYAGTLRESGQTVVPMLAGIAAMLTNLCLNYVLIFGHFGAPAMGVRGAAIATVISRFVELAVNVIWLHCNASRFPYVKGLYRSCYVPGALLRKIVIKGMPLMLNELFWSSGVTVMNTCYSFRGLRVIAAVNINNAIWNVFSVCFITMGSTVGIIMGQMLGAHASKEEVRDTNRKLVFFSIAVSLVFGGLLASVSGLFPKIYNTSDDVRRLATAMILVCAACMPFNTYTNVAYFTLRSGGRTWVTILFDSGFSWLLAVPLVWCLAHLTELPIVPLYAISQGTDVLKTVMGACFVRSDSWIVDITKEL